MITFIDSEVSLSPMYGRISQAKFVSIDTEFVRRTTYYARLSLMQIALENEIYVIDAMAVDIGKLWKDISGSPAVKIIHAGRQDIETLNHLFHAIPNDIFDTQIAASICGFSKAESYADLCKAICEVELDKTLQDTNWSRRPLTKRMLEYAAVDVQYLYPLYQYFIPIIKEKKLEYQLEMITYDLLLNPKLYNSISDNSWRRIRHRHGNNQIFMERLKIIANFREECAKALDIPRRFFVSDAQMIEICEKLPTTIEALRGISDLSTYLNKQKYAERLCEICLGIKEYR